MTGPGMAAAVLFFLAAALPVLVLWRAAASRGLSPAWALWGLLSWVGAIIALVAMRRAYGGGRSLSSPVSEGASGRHTVDQAIAVLRTFFRGLG